MPTSYQLDDEEAEAVESSVNAPCPECGRYNEWIYSHSVSTTRGAVHYLDCTDCDYRGKVLRPV
jgi:predicted RNA-binding Zn-ribbon protein involved in translation (DUF1610 family)